jgi:hypothetical protein
MYAKNMTKTTIIRAIEVSLTRPKMTKKTFNELNRLFEALELIENFEENLKKDLDVD